MRKVWVYYAYNLENGARGVIAIAYTQNAKRQIGVSFPYPVKAKWITMDAMPEGLIAYCGDWRISVTHDPL